MKMKWPKALRVALHALGWLLLFSLPFLLRAANEPRSHERFAQNHQAFQYLNIINHAIWIGLFYLNAYIIAPALLKKKNAAYYAGTVLLIFALLVLVDWLFFRLFTTGLPYQPANFISMNFFPIVLVLAASTAYRVIDDYNKAEKLQKEKVTENLKTELSLLRSQVSPHFMFNVLNNMVALARKGSDQLEPSLIKLSSLLRYMLYETTEKVSLQKEVEYLQSYIDLQRQRFGKTVHIQTVFQPIDGRYEIEPMLLIPFVENAFKHGTGLIEAAEIDIDLKAENGVLSFSVKNRYNPDSTEIKDEASGIGLANVQRRLHLLYAQNHQLLITKGEEWFTVALQIVLQ